MFEKIKALMVDNMDVDPDIITENTSFIDDLGADSLDLVDLLMSLEDELEISVPMEEAKTIRTVGDLVEVIEKLK